MVCTNCQREIADYSNFCYFCGARQHVSPGCPPRAQKRLMRSSVDHKIAVRCRWKMINAVAVNEEGRFPNRAQSFGGLETAAP